MQTSQSYLFPYFTAFRSQILRLFCLILEGSCREFCLFRLDKKFVYNENCPLKTYLLLFAENSEPWKWVKSSEVHRDKLTKLLEYGKENPEEVMEINGVRVCCSEEFLIGMGDDGTRVYVGLGRDGWEKAVKRLPKDACASIAEHEQKILNELNKNQSNHVVKYWFFDHESDRNYVYLILNLYEETLESYVHHESSEPLAEKAPEIICQVLEGLADLHGNLPPILHRDLKPSNILRNVHGKWLLGDFGISRFLKGDASTYTSKERGTLDWIAVESYVKDEHAQVRYKKESDIQV